MTPSAELLAGKVALVTGASRGIGAAISRALASHGASVAAHCNNHLSDCQTLVEEIRASGRRAEVLQADFSARGSVEEMFREFDSLWDHLDILVNNAGILEIRKTQDVDSGHIERMFQVNVNALLIATREAVRRFNDPGACIVNVSSYVGASPTPGVAVYCATKAAVDAITVACAHEFGPLGVRVNAVAPGTVDTAMYQSSSKAAEEYLKSRTPLRRIGMPEEVADAVAFLASDAARFITGHVLSVGGGIRP